MAAVQVQETEKLSGPLVLEPSHRFAEEVSNGLQFGNSLVQLTDEGCAQVLIENPTGITKKLEMGVWLGQAGKSSSTCPKEGWFFALLHRSQSTQLHH